MPTGWKARKEGQMPWKTNEDGTIEMEGGNPVFIHADGKATPFDGDSALSRIAALNKESKDRRLKIDELTTKLDAFASITDPAEAMKAIELVKNLDAKKLVDAGQVDTLKAEMAKIYTEREASLKGQWQKTEDEYKNSLKSRDDLVYSLMVESRFASSPLIKEKTNLLPEIAADHFKKHFKVEGDGTDRKVVGYLPNGEKILSKTKFGETADFEEALSIIFEAHPLKDKFMTAGSSSGSGSTGNTNQGGSQRVVTIPGNDPKAFGDNLEKIAKGEVRVAR
jgi:hypothetical protein